MHLKLLVDDSGQPGNTCGSTADDGRRHLPNQIESTHEIECSILIVSLGADHLVLSLTMHNTIELAAVDVFVLLVYTCNKRWGVYQQPVTNQTQRSEPL